MFFLTQTWMLLFHCLRINLWMRETFYLWVWLKTKKKKKSTFSQMFKWSASDSHTELGRNVPKLNLKEPPCSRSERGEFHALSFSTFPLIQVWITNNELNSFHWVITVRHLCWRCMYKPVHPHTDATTNKLLSARNFYSHRLDLSPTDS